MENKVEFIDDEEIVTLYDDQGTPVDFYEIAVIDYEDQLYALLQPVQAIDGVGPDEAIICRLEDGDDDTDLFLPVESEDLLQKVFDEYLKALDDYDDCDCECDCEDCEGSCDCDDDHCDCGCDHKGE